MILVVGGKGSMGKRYCAILDYLKQPYCIMDMDDYEPLPGEYSKAIIATPTPMHLAYCKRMESLEKTYLCEKPLSYSVDDCKELEGYKNGYVVCNYKYLVKSNKPKIMYDYFNHGKDNLWVDCCQLLYLDNSAIIRTKSPIWLLQIDYQGVRYEDLELSYISMVNDFLKGKYENLWTLEDGRKMTQAVNRRMRSESIIGDSS